MPLLPPAFPTAFHNKTTEVFPTEALGVTSSSLTPVFPTTAEINDPTEDTTLQGPTARVFSTNTVPGVFSVLQAFAHLDPVEEAPGDFPRGTDGLRRRPGLTLVAAGRGLEQQPPAEEGSDGQGGREAEAGKEAHFWGVLSAAERLGTRGRVLGNLPCLFKHTQPELG